MDNGYRIFILEPKKVIYGQLLEVVGLTGPIYIEHVSKNGERNVWFDLSSNGTASCTKPGELALISKLL